MSLDAELRRTDGVTLAYYPRDETLFFQGKEAQHLGFVLSGTVSVWMRTAG